MARIPGLRRVFRLSAGRSAGQAVDEELAFHLDMLADELTAAGLDPATARAEAERRFGDVAAVRRRCRHIATSREGAMRRAETFTMLRQDLGYGARRLLRAPGFTLVVLLTLALGIGASTAIFSVVRGVLLRPLPFPQPERLVRAWPRNLPNDIARGAISVVDAQDWQRRTRAFERMAGYYTTPGGLTLAAEEPVRLGTTYVTEDFFRTLGTRPALGRPLLPEQHRDGDNRYVVLSHAAWRNRFGADPGIVGRSVRLDDEAFTVVGVMPEDFRFPSPATEAWVPSTVIPESGIPRERITRWMQVVGRLAPGVSIAQAEADLSAISRQLAAEFPDSNAGWESANVVGLRDEMVGNVRRGLLVVFGAVGFVLLIACVNIANLLLARSSTRAREFAVRTALGAGRGRLARQLLTESLLLAAAGGALGVALAWYGVRALVALSGEYLPRAADVRVDATVLLFAAGASLLTGVLFGILPALRAARPDLTGVLKESGRAATAGAQGHRLRSTLVMAEVALAVVLVAGAGLMLRSFARLSDVNPGFDMAHTLVVRYTIPRPDSSTTDEYLLENERIMERVRQVPGVVAVGSTKSAPLRGQGGEPRSFTIPGRPVPEKGAEPQVEAFPVTPGFFQAMGIPLLAGRDLTADDAREGRPVVLMSQAAARRYWPNESAVGERIAIGQSMLEVVGVVGDIRGTRLDAEPEPVMYVPVSMMPRVIVALAVRTQGEPAAVAPALRSAIREVAPQLPITEIVPLRRVVADSVSTPRFFTVLVTLFGGIALALAAVGLYGVVSYVVGQRRQEIGVRVALGATRGEVVRLMLWRGMAPVLAGLAVGLATALALNRLLASLLYEVSATDPLTYAGVAALLAIVGLAAAWIPARTAARVDPVVTLREG